MKVFTRLESAQQNAKERKLSDNRPNKQNKAGRIIGYLALGIVVVIAAYWITYMLLS